MLNWYLDETGYAHYISTNYSLSDTHGGHSWLHKIEQEELVNDIVQQKIELAIEAIRNSLPQYIEQYVDERLDKLVEGYFKGQEVIADVTAQVAIDGAGNIFKSREVKRFISDEIYRQIKEQMRKSGLKVK